MADALSSLAQGALARLRALWADSPEAAAIFGAPVRVYDQPPAGAAFPFIRFVRSERTDNGADSAPGQTLALTFNLWDRADRRARLQAGMEALVDALDAAPGLLTDGRGRLVLALPTLSDLFLAEDGRLLRGILRVRIVIDQISNP